MTHKISGALPGPSTVIYNRLSRILAQHLNVLHDRNQMALYMGTFVYLSVLAYLFQVATGKIDLDGFITSLTNSLIDFI